MSENRTRHVTWGNPQHAFDQAQSLSGLEFLKKIVSGEIDQPPIADLMGFRLVEVLHGEAVFEVEPAEYHYNPIGSVHGGLAATLCDAAMACAIQSTLPAGRLYTTLELKINYLRPLLTSSGRVICKGSIIHVGRQIATAEARVVDHTDKLYAHATTTCMAMKLGSIHG